jgi:hypothetical protein
VPVAPEDAENIANIEKLTGQTIERLGTVEAEAAPPTDAPSRERSRRGRRERPEPRVEARGEPAVDAPARDEPVEAPRREQGAEAPRRRDERGSSRPDERPAFESRPPRDERRPRHDTRDDGPDDGWNGPVPDFLNAVIGA